VKSTNEEQSPPQWMAWLMLGAAVGLALLLAFVTWRTFAASAPLCDRDFPARVGQYPSWVYIFGAVGGFVLGHATGQIGIRRRKGSQKELGEGPWGKPSAVVAVNAGVAVFLLAVTVMLGIEAWTLGHNTWPITYYTRCATDASAPLALLGSATYAYVIGRWMWVFRK
jgi:hypothetical protein